MKRKYILVLGIIVILFVLGVLWYKIAVEKINIDLRDVSKISIFDGTIGQGVEITDEAEMEYFLNHLNALQLKRNGLSLGRMGYRYRVTIFTKDNRQREFIINSADTIRKDPFFYRVENGVIDIEFIESLYIK